MSQASLPAIKLLTDTLSQKLFDERFLYKCAKSQFTRLLFLQEIVIPRGQKQEGVSLLPPTLFRAGGCALLVARTIQDTRQ